MNREIIDISQQNISDAGDSALSQWTNNNQSNIITQAIKPNQVNGLSLNITSNGKSYSVPYMFTAPDTSMSQLQSQNA